MDVLYRACHPAGSAGARTPGPWATRRSTACSGRRASASIGWADISHLDTDALDESTAWDRDADSCTDASTNHRLVGVGVDNSTRPRWWSTSTPWSATSVAWRPSLTRHGVPCARTPRCTKSALLAQLQMATGAVGVCDARRPQGRGPVVFE